MTVNWGGGYLEFVLLDFFRIPLSGFGFFCLLGASKRLRWIACDSKLSSWACLRSFSNLSSALKCWACKYRLCSMAKRSRFSNSSTRLFSSTGEEACLLDAKSPGSFPRSSRVWPFLAPLSRIWLRTRKFDGIFYKCTNCLRTKTSRSKENKRETQSITEVLLRKRSWFNHCGM